MRILTVARGAAVEGVLPFRWDLAAGDALGSMPLAACNCGRVHGLASWFVDELTGCAAQVLARSGGGPLYCVGRSGDSLRDLLAAALRGTSHADAPRLLPFSLPRGAFSVPRGHRALTPREVRQWRANTRATGLSPAGARARRAALRAL